MKRYLSLLALLILGVSGCQSFKEPPIATTENLFQSRKRDAADDLLKDITVLTIEDAQRIALKNNPDYKSAAYAVNAAKMAYYQALGAYSPTFGASFSMSNTHTGDSHDLKNTVGTGKNRRFSTSTSITANWLVFDGLARYFNAKAAKAGEKYQLAMEENAARNLLSGVVYAYNSILLARAELEIAKSDLEFQQICLKETELKQEVGTVPYSDVLNFKIRARSAENAMLVAERSYALATYALAVLMGYPDGKIPEWISFDEIKVDVDAVLPSVEVYLDAALANRPDLRAVRENLNIRKYAKYSAYSAYSPTISAFAEFNVSTSNTRSYRPNSIHSHSTTPSFAYGASANWTIFNGFVRFNKVREAQANEAIAKFNVVSAWLSVIQEVRDSYTNYIFSVNQAKLYEQILAYSTEQRDLVAKEYEAGTIGITRLNEVQNDLINAESTLVSAYLNIKNAKVQLDTAAGLITQEFYLKSESDIPQAENTNVEVQKGNEIIVKSNQSAFIKELDDVAEEEEEVATQDGKVVVPEQKDNVK